MSTRDPCSAYLPTPREVSISPLGLTAALAALVCGASVPAQESADEAAPVCVATLDGQALTPITERYVTRAIRTAEDERAECLVLVLDTPGGLLDSTRALVKSILGARVPVVVYVPAGGRAASAGVFVTLAAHVAAMAPGSNIGAAHPVQVGSLPIAPRTRPEESAPDALDSLEILEQKAVQDTAAWARALAELRGRNPGWAERAVTESLSVSATEALREGVIDFLASDTTDLLEQLDGRSVELARGRVVLSTARRPVKPIAMWWGERVLASLAHPNVAFLLVIFGFYGILFELYSPGWGVAGTLGVIALCLGFFALAVLPINYAGLLLLALALGLFVAEAFVTSYGMLALAGVACLVLGGLMLVDSPAGFLRVSLGVVLPVAAATGVITVFLVSSSLRAYRQRVQTGCEALVGAVAIAKEDFVSGAHGFQGLVQTHGELWSAESPQPVRAGDELEVQERKHMTLSVVAAPSRETVGA